MPIINQVVKGGGSGPTGLYREFQLDNTGKLIPSTTSTHIMDFTGVTDVSDYALYKVYYNNTAISGVLDMSDLATISGIHACDSTFQGCTGLTSVDLSGLTTTSTGYGLYYMFTGCTGLTSVDLSSLTTIGGTSVCSYMFASCTGLTSINMSAVTEITSNGACSYIFSNCTGLTSVDLSGLTTVKASGVLSNAFNKCTSLATVYIGGTTAIDFGTYTNQFTGMFNSCTQNIDVYAPAASQSAIEAMSGYPNFGGTGTVTWHWRS